MNAASIFNLKLNLLSSITEATLIAIYLINTIHSSVNVSQVNYKKVAPSALRHQVFNSVSEQKRSVV